MDLQKTDEMALAMGDGMTICLRFRTVSRIAKRFIDLSWTVVNSHKWMGVLACYGQNFSVNVAVLSIC